MKKYRVGVIGCGRISKMYLEVFKNLEDTIEPVIVIDKVIDRAVDFASNFSNCEASSSINDLLNYNLDVVHVLTPHFLHKEHVEFCLKNGIDVLTEKPIAITTADGLYMTELANSLKRNFGVIFQNRYIEGIQEIKRLMSEGVFGKPVSAWSHLSWFRPPSYYQCDWKGKWATEGGGVVIDQAIHSIDLVRYVFELPVVGITATTDKRVLTTIEVEDVAEALIEFAGGVNYSFYACNYNTHNSPITIEFNFENGTALLEETKVTIHLNDQEPYTVIPPCGINVSGKGYWGSYHLYQIREFYDALSSGKKVPWDGYDALKTLEIVLGIYESSNRKKKICY